jgi:hypothetical protein
MVFVPKWHGRHLGAFGTFNRPTSDLKSDLSRMRDRCRKAAIRLQGPYTGRSPLDALRHQYAHVMQLDVIFQPLKGWLPVREKNVRTHSKSCAINRHGNLACSCKWNTQAFAWIDNPVWGHAPNGALAKARRLCSTLNSVVSHGYLCDLTHDLVRIAKMIWLMSQKDFFRLCRRITARIAAFVRANEQSFRKSPEPVERFGTLTTNPANPCRVSWFTRARNPQGKGKRYIPRYVPPHRRKDSTSDGRKGIWPRPT